MTDADGQFRIAGLPAGRYSVVYSKSGFAQAQYGQKRPNQPGKPIDLVDGQKIENADIALMRGGVISGRVFDDFGEPVVDARVQVMQHRWMNGRKRLVNIGRMGQTNDRGEFRVWGLPPGEFYVSAVIGDRQMFFDSVSAAADTPDPTGYAATYYPGTAIQDEAQRISVSAGQETNGIDFTLVTTRTVRVSGTAFRSDGRPMSNANVILFSRAAMEGGTTAPVGGGTDSAGNFTIPGVAPGEYVLNARSMMGMRDMENAEIASLPLNVGIDDVKNVVLVAHRGVRVSGKVTFEGAAPAGALDGLRVFLPPVESEGMFMAGAGFGEVTSPGTFDVKNVFGKRRVTLSGLPSGWQLKAARIGGNDVIDTGYDFGKEDVTNVELVVTNRAASLSGTVRKENQAATDYVVLAFSTDEAHWNQQGSRRMTVARPDQHGTYRINTLPPGSYYVVALEAMPEDWGNPELFEQLKSQAKRVTLGEDGHEELTLTLAGP
jgi:protocatechuate 3,4-dioxygenase beta subunit